MLRACETDQPLRGAWREIEPLEDVTIEALEAELGTVGATRSITENKAKVNATCEKTAPKFPTTTATPRPRDRSVGLDVNVRSLDILRSRALVGRNKDLLGGSDRFRVPRENHGGDMHKLYLFLAVVGFAIPLSVLPATLQHGNLLLIAKPGETAALLFGNYASAAFAADLLWVFVALAFLFGVSGPFPLFLYDRERARAAA